MALCRDTLGSPSSGWPEFESCSLFPALSVVLAPLIKGIKKAKKIALKIEKTSPTALCSVSVALTPLVPQPALVWPIFGDQPSI